MEKVAGLSGDIEPVEAVEEREGVPLREQERLPVAPGFRHATGSNRLHDHHAWAGPTPIGTSQYVGFGTFDIDLKKIDLAHLVLGNQRRERQHGHAPRLIGGAKAGRRLGMILDRRGESVQPIDDVKVHLALPATDEAANSDVARPHERIHVGKRALRLDDQSAPALEVEPKADVVGNGVPPADVDVEAFLAIGKHQIEVVVLEPLGVGDLHRLGSGTKREGYGLHIEILEPLRFREHHKIRAEAGFAAYPLVRNDERCASP